MCNFCFLGSAAQSRAMVSSLSRFLDHTRDATVGRTPLDEWSTRRRYLYLTTHNTHNRKTSMSWWDSNPRLSKRAAVDLRLRPLGHWGRLCATVVDLFCIVCIFVTWRVLFYCVCIVVLHATCRIAGNKSISGRFCDRPPRHRFFLVSLCLKPNAEMLPKTPSWYYMLIM
jgi:hypothetical protein